MTLSSHEVFTLLWWEAALYCAFPPTLWAVIWSALCFYFAWRAKRERAVKNSHQIKKFSHRWWCLNDAYVMFIRNSPLLDILHRDFLYRAPWHDILLLHPRLKRKNNQTDRQNPLLASTSDQTGLRKFARRRFLCHSSASDPENPPRRWQTRCSLISLRQISCPTFARSDLGRS